MSINNGMYESKHLIDEETFIAFCDLRDRGTYNMLDPRVRDELCITKEEHMYIITNFSYLSELYGVEL